MKRLVTIYVVVIGWVLVASAGDTTLVNLDIQRAKSLSVGAIRKKYPETDGSALQYAGLTASTVTNGQIAIQVRYLVEPSGSSEYFVQMDTFGRVMNVWRGSHIDRRSVNRKDAASQPAQAAEKPSPGK